MEFEWDEDKRQAVLGRRGVDLARAALVLLGPVIVKEDDGYDYSETRYIATGEREGAYFTVVYTRDGDTFRIVTAWRAGRRARRQFEEYQAGLGGGVD